jgi:hypothetical protein
MNDFNVRSDAVNVEQIMEQIRARIREKRGVDYTEDQIRELASVKLEKFLDPRGVRSDLLEQFRRAQPPYAPPELPNYAFEADTLFTSTRAPLRFIRRLLLPILKLFFNPNPLIQALNIQSRLNAGVAEREAQRDTARYAFDQLHYEVMHNLVLETTRLGIEVKNLKMRLESMGSRLEFNERRARALESVVAYKPAPDERPARQEEPRREESRRDDGRREENRREENRRSEGRRSDPPARPQPPAPQPPAIIVEASEPSTSSTDTIESVAQTGAVPEGPGQKSRRRRRRRGRRGSGAAAAIMGAVPESDAGGEGDADDDQVSEGEGDAAATESAATESSAGDSPAATHAADADSDRREARPEPFEHTFGAQAHPAEDAASDPAHTAAAPPSPSHAATTPTQASTPADPSTTPES